ncbi:MAG: type II secretion system protein E [Chloroflexota bacterium]|nr:MAG: type II secretion system protein E [Chloroflexota bacterium]
MTISDQVNPVGLLESLYNDREVSAIFVNAPDRVYVERKGKIQEVNSQFKDNEALWAAIHDLLKPSGQKLDPAIPLLKTRLPDGSWVNLVMPPAVLSGPVLTIRKAHKDPLTIQDLIRFGSTSPEIAEFLRACVKARLNILVSGGTNSGKTTVLKVIASFIPDDSERIIVIEGSAELDLPQKHVVTLTAGPVNLVGKEEITMRDLVLNSLNMVPSRIILTELEGNEAMPLLQAMTTGHDGCMTSIHANNPYEALIRLETMITQANLSMPVQTIREMIATGINLIVQQNRLRDGSRKMMKLTEVAGMQGEAIVLSDIFEFQETGVEGGRIRGRITSTGHIPGFMNRLDAAGVQLPLNMFDQKKDENP